MLVGALPTRETNQNCTSLFSVQTHGCQEPESVQWPQHARDKCGSEIFLSVTCGKLEGKVRLLLVTVSFLACLPALQLCSAPPVGQGIIMVMAALGEENRVVVCVWREIGGEKKKKGKMFYNWLVS